MKVKKVLLSAFLKKNGMTVAEFALEIGASASEVEKLLNGEAVGVGTARKFIAYVGAGEAARLIDWAAIGKENPFAGGGKKGGEKR
ncbi:MAG: helix-turn-helix transcriptional regulator [Clostridiales bacterium]|jgi:plasmid maintenance system antidote protein VapI|nr:helix-turn-helix transcriptional regulator [Clostridiales bacterium]